MTTDPVTQSLAFGLAQVTNGMDKNREKEISGVTAKSLYVLLNEREWKGALEPACVSCMLSECIILGNVTTSFCVSPRNQKE